MNKKIKVIELLNRKANNEQMPKKVYFREYEYSYHNDDRTQGYYRCVYDSNWVALTTDFEILKILNSEIEVEILEDKKEIEELDPNKVYFKDGTEDVYKLMFNKINELVFVVNELDKKIKKED